MKERLWYIDWMKALGMLFIIIGHFAPSTIAVISFAFSVQLFFFVSGFLYKPQDSSKSLLVKNIRTLLVPYLIWGGLLILFLFLRTRFLPELGKSVMGLLLGMNNYEGIRGCGELWFIVTLFGLKLVTHPIKLNHWMICFSTLISVCLAICYCSWIEGTECQYSGVGLLNVFVAFPFFVLGYVLSSYKGQITSISNRIGRKWIPWLVLGLIGLVYGALKNGLVLMIYGQYGNSYVLFLLLGFVGIFCSWIIASLLSKTRFNNYAYTISIGTIAILATHVGVLNRIKPLLLSYLTSDCWQYDLLSCIVAFLLLLLYIPIIAFIKRHFPILLGNR